MDFDEMTAVPLARYEQLLAIESYFDEQPQGEVYVWVCNLCGQPLKPGTQCHSSLHVSPDGGRKGLAIRTDRLVRERRTAIEALRRVEAIADITKRSLTTPVDTTARTAQDDDHDLVEEITQRRTETGYNLRDDMTPEREDDPCKYCGEPVFYFAPDVVYLHRGGHYHCKDGGTHPHADGHAVKNSADPVKSDRTITYDDERPDGNHTNVKDDF